MSDFNADRFMYERWVERQAISRRLEDEAYAPKRAAHEALMAAHKAAFEAHERANHNPCDAVVDGAMVLGGLIVVGAFCLLVVVALAAVAF
jgi:hypothetical protein